MKSLIINADDCGLSEEINQAVEICYRAGSITGVSIMSPGACFQPAARMLRNTGKTDVGVHLTLTGNLPPCAEDRAGVGTLLGRNGKFLPDYKSFGSRYLLRGIRQDQVYRELKAQIEQILEQGLSITHLDSHEHVHVFPGVFKVTLKLAEEFNIPYIRIPRENLSVITRSFSIKDLMRYAGLNGLAASAGARISRSGRKYNNAFWGHFHSGRIDDDILCFIMENLGQGVNELAVHPAVASREFLEEFPWHRNARKELGALMDGRWKTCLDPGDVRLVSHRQAAA
ncbi:MAG: ChbG/HpnK family deacetylase [Candidatus Omnitrophica bacterium]|nr:ChbG/HpnK family deacetylase [Candidatus Omnitrophota bacterium]